MASYKDYKTVSAAQKAGSMYFIGKDGKKKLAVTAEQLKTWKKKNKGKFKGSALTAWANNKGKDIKGVLRPKARPKSSDMSDDPNAHLPKITVTTLRKPLDRGKRDPDNPKLKSIEEMITITEKALRDDLKNRTRYDVTEIAKRKKRLRDLKGRKTGLAKGGMMKKKGYAKGGKVMSYNLGGMVKSQTNNLKRGG